MLKVGETEVTGHICRLVEHGDHSFVIGEDTKTDYFKVKGNVILCGKRKFTKEVAIVFKERREHPVSEMPNPQCISQRLRVNRLTKCRFKLILFRIDKMNPSHRTPHHG